MKRGDSIYRIGGGEYPCQLERATFLEESLAEGATLPTWLCRDSNDRKFRCSPSMYVPTVKEAWERHLKEIDEALPSIEKAVVDAQKHLDDVRVERQRVAALLTPA